MGIKQTDLRKIFIIHTLLDCEKWKTPDIIKKVYELESDYFQDIEKYIKPKKSHSSINSAKISPILKELRNDKIIASETIPKDERNGPGPGADRHWLITEHQKPYPSNFLKTLYFYAQLNPAFNLLTDPTQSIGSDDFYFWASQLLNSEYGNRMINKDIIHFYEQEGQFQLNKAQKKVILRLLKISPTACYNSFVYTAALNKFKMRDSEPEEKIGQLLSMLHNGMATDVTNPSIKAPYPIESEIIFKYYPNMPITDPSAGINFEIRGNCIRTRLSYGGYK